MKHYIKNGRLIIGENRDGGDVIPFARWARPDESHLNLWDQILELKAEVAHWKSNHDNQKTLKSQLMDRPDLKDRAESVQKLQERSFKMKELIQILELAANRHGPKHQLTIGHLLNIVKLAERTKTQSSENQAILEDDQHRQLFDEINPLGQD